MSNGQYNSKLPCNDLLEDRSSWCTFTSLIFSKLTSLCVIFQNVKHVFSYDADFIHSLRISPIFSCLQVLSSLVNSSLRFQIVSAAFAVSTFEYYNFKLNFKEWILPLQTFHQVPLKKPQRLHESFVNSNLAKDFLVESHHLKNHASPWKIQEDESRPHVRNRLYLCIVQSH